MPSYIGRFAPSPTGPLHFGSLVAALASWVDARSNNGQWLLRIEDLDPPRETIGAARSIVESLATHGLTWDGNIEYQSKRSDHYEQALQTLRDQQRLYACYCSRKQLREHASITGNTAYPGHCRELVQAELDYALRFRVNDWEIGFKNGFSGVMVENVAQTTGDFIVKRRGHLYAYQLAVVVDDALQGVTHVVRGADLLDNTARQIALQNALGYRSPAYLHVPLVVQEDGRKLSKQTGAKALDSDKSLDNLVHAWRFLNQPATNRYFSNVADFLQYAASHWQPDKINNQ